MHVTCKPIPQDKSDLLTLCFRKLQQSYQQGSATSSSIGLQNSMLNIHWWISTSTSWSWSINFSMIHRPPVPAQFTYEHDHNIIFNISPTLKNILVECNIVKWVLIYIHLQPLNHHTGPFKLMGTLSRWSNKPFKTKCYYSHIYAFWIVLCGKSSEAHIKKRTRDQLSHNNIIHKRIFSSTTQQL